MPTPGFYSLKMKERKTKVKENRIRMKKENKLEMERVLKLSHVLTAFARAIKPSECAFVPTTAKRTGKEQKKVSKRENVNFKPKRTNEKL